MSALKPGWAEQLGQAQAPLENEPGEWQLWRARGQAPFKRPEYKQIESAKRGARMSARGHVGRHLVKVLGKVDSDE